MKKQGTKLPIDSMDQAEAASCAGANDLLVYLLLTLAGLHLCSSLLLFPPDGPHKVSWCSLYLCTAHLHHTSNPLLSLAFSRAYWGLWTPRHWKEKELEVLQDQGKEKQQHEVDCTPSSQGQSKMPHKPKTLQPIGASDWLCRSLIVVCHGGQGTCI